MKGTKNKIKSFMLKKIYEKKQALKSEKNMNHKKYDWKYETKYRNLKKFKTENSVQQICGLFWSFRVLYSKPKIIAITIRSKT